MSEPTPQQEAVIEAAKENYAHRQRCSVRAGCEECAFHRAVLDDKVRMLIASEQPWKMVNDCCLRGPDGIKVEVLAPLNHPRGATGPVKAVTARVCSLLNRASRASQP